MKHEDGFLDLDDAAYKAIQLLVELLRRQGVATLEWLAGLQIDYPSAGVTYSDADALKLIRTVAQQLLEMEPAGDGERRGVGGAQVGTVFGDIDPVVRSVAGLADTLVGRARDEELFVLARVEAGRRTAVTGERLSVVEAAAIRQSAVAAIDESIRSNESEAPYVIGLLVLIKDYGFTGPPGVGVDELIERERWRLDYRDFGLGELFFALLKATPSPEQLETILQRYKDVPMLGLRLRKDEGAVGSWYVEVLDNSARASGSGS